MAQKKFSNRTRFELDDDDFRYHIERDGNSRTFRLEYAELGTDRESMTERSSWWRNVGVIWMVLGVVLTTLHYVENNALRIPIWFWLGLGCYGVFHLRTVRYLILPSDRCNVLIIDDKQGAEIADELERRRVGQLKKRYDYISLNEHPDQQRQRIHWLRKHRVLDEHETSSRLLEIDTMQGVQALRNERREHDDD